MYFPYFRGRQYELLALKELVQYGLLSKKVIPAIEPIKVSSTFRNTLQVYKDNDMTLGLIVNPQVGELVDNGIDIIMDYVSDNTIPSVLLKDDAEAAVNELEKRGFQKDKLLLIIDNGDYISDYREMFADLSPKYTLASDERRIRRAISKNKVLFDDKFNKQPKNADYLKNEDELFSEDHLFYSEEGFIGFGDYSIIGNNYEEGGFSPRAVAIHIVYFNEAKELRIHHFVSDNNYGIEDVAGKYYEAVSKLKTWYNRGYQSQCTKALETMLEHADNGYYPGLPTIKKLSIMHHLELLSKYLDGEIK